MVKKSAIPNAWDDDDWEAQADKAEATPASPLPISENPPKISKAERLAKHAESNKKLWDSAESPEPFHYLSTLPAPPLTTEFKPALKVLSRKPERATGEADEDDEGKGKIVLSPEEARIKAQREREEKQRKYDEARAKIFGTPTPTSTRPSTPGSGAQNEGGAGRGKGRNRGGWEKGMNMDRGVAVENRRPGSSISPGPQAQQQQQQQQRELFDPNYTPRGGGGGVSIQQRGTSSGRSTPRLKEESQVTRQPRAPDGSGRGGFASKGNNRGP